MTREVEKVKTITYNALLALMIDLFNLTVTTLVKISEQIKVLTAITSFKGI